MPVLSDPERHKILVDWNQTERAYPHDKCVHQLFEEQAERTPEGVAVVQGNQVLGYRELNLRANQLARRLRAEGVRPHDLVAVCIDRSVDAIVALLGVLKAGAAYVPMDPSQPEERLLFLLEDTQVAVVIAKGGLSWKLPAATRVVGLDSADLAGPLVTNEEASIPVGPGAVAYVMYTSGSTGNPKGVCVPHRAISRLVINSDYVQLSPVDVVAQAGNLAFDAATFEIWGALLNGARIEIIPKETLLAPERLAALLREKGVSTLFITTALFNLLGRVKPGIFQSLKQVLFGGEAADAYPVQAVLENGAPQRLLHMYGPTEATTFATWQLVKKLPADAVTVPIGRPIANTTVYLLDADQQPVAVGQPGEIYIGGDGLAIGYLNQAEMTDERFVPNPFGRLAVDRLYRTGDLGCWRPDGTIEFFGRLDSQVKIRGFRIELGEIEISLRLEPEISEAVVILREDRPQDKRLTAYLVAKTAERPDDGVLRERLAEKLPEYMIPSSFVWLEQMPLTANGKIDRKTLPAPDGIDRSAKPAMPPVNLLEWEFMRIWQRIFQREDISRQDDFFALGGHSLLATRLAAEIDKILGCKLPIAALFQSPTIELLARRFLDENWAPRWSSLVPLQPQGSKPPLFFVHGVMGDVFVFVELAKLLGLDQPCYGIQAVGLDGKTPRHISVDEMAAHYVKEIISFQPSGPIYLVGCSLGGTFAYEIAQQLRRLDRRVAMLVLLDSAPVGAAPWFYYGLAMASYIPGRCWLHFRRWTRLSFRQKFQYFQGRVVALGNLAVENRSKQPLVTAPPVPGEPAPEFPANMDYYHAITLPYKLQPYPGTLDLFFSDEAVLGWQWYWRHLARGGASFHRITGEHTEILSHPHVTTVAVLLKDLLRRKQAENGLPSPDKTNHGNSN